MVQQPKAAKTLVLRKDNVFANVLRSRKKQRYVAAYGKTGDERVGILVFLQGLPFRQSWLD